MKYTLKQTHTWILFSAIVAVLLGTLIMTESPVTKAAGNAGASKRSNLLSSGRVSIAKPATGGIPIMLSGGSGSGMVKAFSFDAAEMFSQLVPSFNHKELKRAGVPAATKWLSYMLDDGITQYLNFPAGSYIINTGATTAGNQTVGQGLKPYGLVARLVLEQKVPVYWAINPTKNTLGGTDFTYNSVNYSGGPFIISGEWVTPAVQTLLTTWVGKGVVLVGPTATPITNVPIYDVITSFPKAVLDSDNGSIAQAYYGNSYAEIPATVGGFTMYQFKLPQNLNSCDDVYVMPHADPVWSDPNPANAQHRNLLPFNSQGGFIWAACHAVSVLEDIDNPDPLVDPDLLSNMNFLSTQGLAHFSGDYPTNGATASHVDGVAPYTYNPSSFSHPIMQFMNDLGGATENGSEQDYLPLFCPTCTPSINSTWNPGAMVAVYDPDHANLVGGSGADLSNGPAAKVVYGRGFDDPDAGMVMYEGGHNHINGTTAERVAALRAYFNFILLAGINRRPEIVSTGIPSSMTGGASYPITTTITGGGSPYTYSWASSCGGTFQPNNTAASPTFVAPSVLSSTACRLTLTVTDNCGRLNFKGFSPIQVDPAIPTADLAVTKTDSTTSVTAGGSTTYVITVSNAGPDPANGATITDTLGAGLSIINVTCSPAGGAVCPAPLTPFTTLTIPTFPSGGSLTFNVTASVTATSGSVTNSISVSPPMGGTVDPNTSNNSATDTDTVNPSADLSIIKNNGTATVNANGSTTYTIVVSNGGPSAADGAIFKDPAATGLTETGVTCGSPTGGAACPAPASVTVAAMQGAGIAVPTLPAGGSVTFTVTANVTVASGSVTNTATVMAPAGTNDPNLLNNSASDTDTVAAVADMTITKSNSAAAVAGGPAVSYTIQVTNNGPSTAQNVSFTDSLPAGLLFDSIVAPGGWTCTTPAVGTNGSITCNTSSMTNGATASFTLGVRVAASFTGNLITNQATVSTTSTDPNSGNNTGTGTTAVTQSADVSVQKTASPSTVNAGSNVTYTIVVTNNGPSNAQGVTLTDLFPANTSFVSLSGTGFLASCTGGASLSCPTATLTPGQSASVTVILKVNANAPAGPLANTATVTSTTPDPTTPNTSTATVTVARVADLAVTKTASPSSAKPGDTINYTITVTNNGPATVGNGEYQVLDPLPPSGTTINGTISAPGFSCASPTSFPCTGTGTLAAGQSATITFQLTVNSNFAPIPGNVVNTATVGFSPLGSGNGLTDSDSGNNSSTTTTPISSGQADLALTKTASAGPVTAGATGPAGQVTFTLQVVNNGPAAATGVVVSDSVPANTTVVTAPSGLGFTCSGAGIGAGGGTPFTCTPTATPWVVGATGTITYTVSVGAGVPQGTLITNLATITTAGPGATPDPNTANNSGSTQTPVNAIADVRVEKDDSAAAVAGGGPVSYAIRVINAGPSNAQNVQMNDVLPSGLLFNSLSAPAGWSCTTPAVGSPGTVNCTISTLAAGTTANFTLGVRVAANFTGGSITNIAVVSSTTTDSNSGNNTDPGQTSVTQSADVQVVKTVSPSTVNAGNNITYVIAVTNNGPSDAQNVSVTDTFPTNASLISVTGSGVLSGCTGAATLSCPLVTLAAGQSATITVVMQVNANAPSGNISNTVNVASSTPDPTTSNNTSTATATVTRVTDLAVVKTATPSAVLPGEEISYLITVTNNGPATVNALEYQVTDPSFVPSGTTLVGTITAPNFSCNGSASFPCVGNIVLVSGQSTTIAFKVKVNSGFTPVPGAVSNTANVGITTAGSTAGLVDSNATNNSSTVSTPVGIGLADLQLTKTAAPNTVTAGAPGPAGQIAYTITVINIGPADSFGVKVNDTIPANTTVVTPPSGLGFNCTGAIVGSPGGTAFTCTPTANPWPVGVSSTITYVVSVGANTPQGTLVTNLATIGTYGPGATPDPNAANNQQGTTQTLVNGSADLSIQKSNSASAIAGGPAVSYTITVNNAGPSYAANAEMVDVLPAGLLFDGITAPAGWNCTAPAVGSNGTVRCTIPSMPNSSSAVFTLSVKVAAGFTGNIITNVATISSTSSDPVPTNNSDDGTTGVSQSADVAVVKTANPSSVNVGSNVTYTITVTNNGPSDAQNVAVTDTFPANTTFVSISGTGPLAGCTGGAALSCPSVTLAAGQSATLTVTVKVNANAPNGPMGNTVNVASSTPDPTPGNNTSTATVTVTRATDLAVVKTATPSAVKPGDDLFYTITVTNNGPATVNSNEYQVNDPTFVPFGTTLTGTINAPSFSCNGLATFPCVGTGSLAPGQSTTITFQVKVNSNFSPIPGSIVNTAQVAITAAGTAAGVSDNNPSNDSSSVTTPVNSSQADLELTKTSSPSSVTAGAGQIVYTISVRNNGPAAAVGVRVSEIVPPNTTVAVLPSSGAFTCSGVVVGSPGGTQFNCTPNTNPWPVGATATITYTVNVGASVPQGTLVTNAATIGTFGAGATPDPNTANNAGSTQTPINASANLAIVKSDASAAATAGGAPVSYTITVSNLGPSDAVNAQMADVLPAGLLFDNLLPAPGWTCTTPAVGTNGTVLCTLPTLPNGGTASFTLSVRVAAGYAGGPITNIATTSSSTSDPTPGNNSDPGSTPVNQSADVAVTKSATPTTVSVGDTVTYNIVVSNNGPGDAQNVQVTDTFPANTTLVNLSGTGALAGCTGGTSLICPAVTLAAGQSATVTVTLKINANAPAGQLGNTVNVTSSTPDPTPGNNTSTSTITVNRQADLSIVKTATPNAVKVGDDIFYTITVTNNGPANVNAGEYQVTDPTFVPSGTTLVGSIVAPAFICASATLFPCTGNTTLLPGQSTTINFQVKVNSNFSPITGSVVNTAVVGITPTGTTNGLSDPDPSDNSSTVTTPVNAALADLALTKVASPGPVTAGVGTIVYTIAVKNNGPADAFGAQITDTIPANTTVTVAPSGGMAFTCVGAGISSPGGTPFTCTASANPWPVGATATITYTVSVGPSVPQGTLITNLATISTVGPNATPDPNTANNTQGATQTIVDAKADLAILKSDSAAAVAGGAPVSYTLQVTNNGPSDAQNVEVTDVLPAGLLFNSITAPAGWACTTPAVGSGGAVSCKLGTLAAGATNNLILSVRVAANVTTSPMVNVASVTSTTADPSTANNSDVGSTPVTQSADVAILKTAAPSSVAVGDNVTYTIKVTNNGPSDAQNVLVTDTFPAGTSFVSLAGTGPLSGCTGGALLSCPAVTLAAGQMETLTVVLKINASAAAGNVLNTAMVTSPTPDPTPGNNTSTTTINVNRVADLAVVKTASPGAAKPGDEIFYTITVTNNGPSTVNSGEYDVTDPSFVPAGTTLVGTISAPAFTCASATSFPCTNSTALAPGQTTNITFKVKVNSNFAPIPGSIVNTAVVGVNATGTTNGLSDNNTSNNSSTVTTPVNTSQADLQIVKTSTAGPVTAGAAGAAGQITYTLTVKNNGPADAVGVSVGDIVPPNTTIVTAPASAAFTCSGAGVGATGGTPFSCAPNAAPWPAGATATITYTVSVGAAVPQGTLVTNAATIGTFGPNATPDPNPANNSSSTQTPVNTSADVNIVKGNSAPAVAGGGAVSYTITVANSGPSDAQNVEMVDVLPASLRFAGLVSPAGWACTLPAVGTNGTVRCSIPTLNAGASVNFTLSVRVAPGFTGGTITNTATVSSSTNDPTPSNNSDPGTTSVSQSADMAVLKTATPGTVSVGDNLTYTITVTNLGPSDAQNVTINDTFPAGTSFVSLSGTGILAGCTGGASLSCPSVTFPSGQSETITVVVKVNANAPAGPMGNTVTVSSPTPDPTSSNNTSTSTVTVARNADLSVVKTATPNAVKPGDDIFYTITVTNNGPANVNAGEYQVTDPTFVPSGTTLVGSISAPGFACASATTFPCTGNATLVPGQSAIITFQVKVNSNFTPITGAVVNTAVVGITSAGTTNGLSDPDPSDNTSTVTTPVNSSQADLELVKTSTPGPVTAGASGAAGQITYTITVKNNGPADAVGVRVTDIVPPNTTVVTAPSSGAFTCSGAGVGAVGGTQFTCLPNTNPWPAGATATISYTVNVGPGVPQGTLVTNAAVIGTFGNGATPDPNTANNSGTTQTPINASADVVIAKTNSAAAVAGGPAVSYTITVTNNGPSDAQNVEMIDALPTGLRFVSINTPGGWSCVKPAVGSNGTVTCSTPTMAPGATVNFTLSVRVTEGFTGSTITNTAVVTTTTNDPNTGNNSDPGTTNVTQSADVAVKKTAVPATVNVGENLTYSLVVTNAGPSEAQNVAISDTFPANTSFVSLSGTGVFSACTGGASLNCPTVTLPANSSETITVVLKVNANAPAGQLGNTVVVSSTTPDPTPENNQSTVNVTVTRKTDLGVVKTATPNAVKPGDEIFYTVTVTNHGPATVNSGEYQVSDPTFVPAGTTLVGTITAPGFTCASATAFPCTNSAALAPGQTATINFKVKVNSNFSPIPGSVVNTAVVAPTTAGTDAGLADTNPTNDSSTVTTPVTSAVADLELAKTASQGPVIAGASGAAGQITYTIAIKNNGPADAVGVKITDTIPANTTVVTAPSGANFTCSGAPAGSVGGVTFTCAPTANPWPAGSTATITYVVSVGPDVPSGTLVTNTANIGTFGPGATPDPNPANNTQGATQTLVNSQADLAIVKSNSANAVAGGAAVSYTITVTNNGPSSAQNAEMADVLPAGLRFVSLNSPAGWTCTSPAVGTNGTVRCTLPTMAPSTTANFTLTVRVAPGFTGSLITNTATISSSSNDPNPGNNSDPGTTAVTQSADVTVVKTANPTSVSVGDNVTYTITVSNSGPSDAQNVAISDTFPAGTTFVGLTGTGPLAACTGGASLACPLFTLPADTSETLTVTVQVNANATAGVKTNTVTVTSSTPDPTTPNQSSANINVTRKVDLSVVKTATPNAVKPGDEIFYTITLTNHGPATVNTGEYQVTDPTFVPAGTTLVGTISAPAFACNGGATFPCVGNTTLTAGQTATISFKVKVNSNFTPIPGSVVNTAVAGLTTAGTGAGLVETDPTNDSSTVITPVNNSLADLELAKTASPGPVTAGASGSAGQITYSISVKNNGPADAVGVKITDTIPANTTVVTAPNGANFTCSGAPVGTNGGATFTCMPTANPWPAGSSATITYVVSVGPGVPQGTLVTNTANIGTFGPGATPDSNAANNTQGPTQTVVNASADVAIQKGDSAAAVAGGAAVSYSITVANNGPSDAQNVEVVDALPSGLLFEGVAAPAGWNCATPAVGQGGTVTCTLPTLASGATANITLTVKVAAGYTGNSITNVSTVKSSTSDPNATNNSDPGTTAVSQSADLVLTKSASPSTVKAGDLVTYTLVVRNNGPSDSQAQIAINDNLPDGLTYVSADTTGAPGFVCAAGPNPGPLGPPSPGFTDFHCTLAAGSIPAGTQVNIVLTAKVGVTVAAGVLTNQAVVRPGTTGDPNSANNNASADITVQRVADLAVVKTATPNAVKPGDEIFYTIVVTNNGPSTAAVGEYQVADSTFVPAGTTLVGTITAPAFNCASATSFPCVNNVALAPTETATITFKVKVNSNFAPIPGSVVNTAEVGITQAGGNAGLTDNNTTNNSSSVTTPVNNSLADLELAKTASPGPVTAGASGSAGQVTYSIAVKNNGPADAVGVKITDTIPANTTVVTAPSGPGFTCSGAPVGTAGGATFTCAPTANPWPVGSTATITYVVSVGPGVPQGTLVTNTANIGTFGPGATPDSNNANNTQGPTQTLVNASADVAIQKSNSAAAVAGGAAVSYTITVTNNGPSDAQNVEMADALPTGLRFVSLTSPAGWNCVNPAVGQGGTVTCTIGSMAPGATASFVLSVRVAPNFQGSTITNVSTVKTTTSDPNTANNSDPGTTEVTRSADLTIVKTAAPATVSVGDNVTYTITVTNNGPSDAQGVVVTDAFPASLSFVSLSGTGPLAGCTGGASLTCPAVTLPAGDSATLTVVLKVKSTAPAGVLPNTAAVTSTTPDPTTPNTSTANVTVTRDVDLAIAKVGTPEAVKPGDEIFYTITVTNKGPATVNSGEYQVIDPLPPAGTTLQGLLDAPSFSCNGGTAFPCVGTSALAPGQIATIKFRVKVNSNFTPIPGFVLNTATVGLTQAGTTAGLAETDPTNNTVTEETAVNNALADLELTKTASAGPVIAGASGASGQITYTIVVKNNGPADAVGVRITDTTPANTTVVTPPSGPNFTCNGAAAGAVGGVTFTCTPTTNPWPIGSTATITYVVSVGRSVSQGTLITNQANISTFGPGATPDPNPANNTQGPTQTLVNTSADLSVNKQWIDPASVPQTGTGGTVLPSNPTVYAGQLIAYRITVTNDGPSDAQNVIVEDDVPPNTTFVAVNASSPAYTCSAPNGTITCSRVTMPGPFPVSDQIFVTLRVNANTPAGEVITNTARIRSTTPDPDNGDLQKSITALVETDADLTIVKAAVSDTVVAGNNLTYRLTVTNNGPSDAQNVKVVDTLPNVPPNAVSYVSVSGTGVFSSAGACSHAAGIVTCNAIPGGVMKPGESANIDIVVKVNSNVPANTTLTNSATAIWEDSDPDEDTATATAATQVKHESDAKIVKEAPAEVVAGQRMDYKLTVTNMGPSDVLGGAQPGTMMVMDTLPVGVTPVQPMTSPSVTVVGPGGFTCSYDSATRKVTCVNAAGTAGNVPANAVVQIIFKVEVATTVADGTNLNNCANVSLTSPEFDPVSGNNDSCDSTVVRNSADLTLGKTAQPVNPAPNTNPPAVRAGENIRYTLTFGNSGPSGAVNVKITDVIPGNTTFVPSSLPATILATGGVYTGPNSVKVACAYDAATNQLTCTPTGNTGLTPSVPDGVLPAGVTGTITYEVTVNGSVAGGTIVSNAANIASAANGSTPGTPDPNTANNTTLTTSTPVVASSQLTITKIVQSAVTQASNPNETGPLGPASPTGPTNAPGTATTGTAVVPGTELTYRLVVTNNGPSDISNVQVVDTLPAGTSYLGANQISGNATFTCFFTGGAVTCNAPVLPGPQIAGGNTVEIEVVVKIDPAYRNNLVNNARVNGTATGFNQPVGAATRLTTPVQPVSDLATTKTHTPDPVVAGTNAVYTIKVQNFGPSTAMSTTIVDQLPKGQTFVSAEVLHPVAAPGMPPAMTCAVTTPATSSLGDKVTCTGSMNGLSLAPNEFVTLKLTAKVDPNANPGLYVNQVTATSTSALPSNPRNVANDNINIIARPDLAMAKSAPATVIAGETMIYTLTATNNGPSSAKDLMISDPLPNGTVFVAVTASAGGEAAGTNPAVGSNGTVKYTWPGLTGPGQTRELTITVRVCADVTCNTNLANTASVSYTPRIPNPLPPSPVTTPPFVAPGDWDKDPNPANNSATATTKTEAKSDLSITKSGPPIGRINSTINYTINFSNAGPSSAAGVVITDTLPLGFVVDGTPTSTVPGTTFEITTVAGQTIVKANIGVLGADNQCVTNPARPKSGTITIPVKIPPKHPIIVVTNTATISTTNCLADPNLANNTATVDTSVQPGGVEVGLGYPADAEVSDQKAGSILVFPIYTSDAVNPAVQDTAISITNLSDVERACIHLFAVDGATCSTLDMFVCLTPNQTTKFLASDLDPGNSGYMMAVAVDCETGLPISFNCLIGDELVKFSTGHQANFGAEAIAAEKMFPAGTNANATTATLKFNGVNYNRLPRVLAADSIPSPANGNSTMLILDRIGGNYTTAADRIGNINGLLYDDAEIGFSFTARQDICQYRTILSNSFPRTLTPFSRIIPAGRTGWMKFWPVEDAAMFGVMINFNPNTKLDSNAYVGGHALHKLTLTDKVEIIIPLFVPTC